MMRRRHLLACLAPPALPGCGAVALPRNRPTIPPRFPDAPAETGWPDAAWWHAFGSTEMNALIAAAGTGNRDIQAAAERVLQAEASARIAGSTLFPSIGFGVQGSRAAGHRSWSAGADATWEVDLWGRLRREARAGQMRALSSRFDHAALALSIRAETATGYIRILALRAQRAQSMEALAVARRILEVMAAQATAGGLSELEVYQQRSAVASQEASLAELAGQERQQQHALALLTGRAPGEVDAGTGSLDRLTLPVVRAGLPADLLSRRPDLAQAETDLVAAGLDASVARDARLPRLSLTGSAGRSTEELADLLTPGRLATRVLGSLALPVFEGGRLHAAEAQATARMRELSHRYAAAILSAFRDVADALAASAAAIEAYALRRTGFEAASRAYGIADARWRAGAADFLSVLQTQQSVFSAADALSQADAGRYIAVVALYRALGGGWSPPEGGEGNPGSNAPRRSG